MTFETRRILSAMTNIPNPQDVLAALDALDRGAQVVASQGGVDPTELARTWASRRAGPFLSPNKYKVVDALLAELGTGGTAPWVLLSIRRGDDSFILFVDAKGVGRACIKMTA